MCKNLEPYLVIRNDIYSDIYSDLDLDLDLGDNDTFKSSNIDLDYKSFIYISLYEDDEIAFGKKKCDECIIEDIKYEKLINDIYEMYLYKSFVSIDKLEINKTNDRLINPYNQKSNKILTKKGLSKKIRNFFRKL